MAEETFRLPKSSYDELVKIIQAYGNSGQAVNLDEVARTAVMDTTIISRNNAFLMSVGIIEGGRAKGITGKGRPLAQALHYNVVEDIATQWREVVNANDFLQKMVTAVRIRGGMEESALQSHIAYSAGESKSPHVMAGAGAVVQILKVSGLVKEQDGKLIAGPPTTGVSFIKLAADLKQPEKTGPSAVVGVSAELVPQTSNLGVSIQIQIQCTAAEIPDLAPKLRKMLKELSMKEDGKAEGQD
jgi:hypothetical protein